MPRPFSYPAVLVVMLGCAAGALLCRGAAERYRVGGAPPGAAARTLLGGVLGDLWNGSRYVGVGSWFRVGALVCTAGFLLAVVALLYFSKG